MKNKEFKVFKELVIEASLTSLIWRKEDWFNSLTEKQRLEIGLILKHKPEVAKHMRGKELIYVLPGGKEFIE